MKAINIEVRLLFIVIGSLSHSHILIRIVLECMICKEGEVIFVGLHAFLGPLAISDF